MDVGSPLIAHFQPFLTIQPGMGPLDDPAVTAEFLLRLNAFAGDARRNATLTQGGQILLRLVPFVGVQLVRSFPWSPAWTLDRLDRIQTLFEHRRLVDVGCGQQDGQRDPLAVDHKMALRALFAAIRWILPGFFAPPGEATVEASIAARLQSIRSAWPSRSRKTRWRRSQTPAFCQSRSRRQQVIPDPQPISGGSISHGVPVMSTKRMPVRAARSEIGGRPPLGRGSREGSKGSMTAHSSSETIGLAIGQEYQRLRRFC
jgi:hypothetical protein